MQKKILLLLFTCSILKKNCKENIYEHTTFNNDIEYQQHVRQNKETQTMRAMPWYNVDEIKAAIGIIEKASAPTNLKIAKRAYRKLSQIALKELKTLCPGVLITPGEMASLPYKTFTSLYSPVRQLLTKVMNKNYIKFIDIFFISINSFNNSEKNNKKQKNDDIYDQTRFLNFASEEAPEKISHYLGNSYDCNFNLHTKEHFRHLKNHTTREIESIIETNPEKLLRDNIFEVKYPLGTWNEDKKNEYFAFLNDLKALYEYAELRRLFEEQIPIDVKEFYYFLEAKDLAQKQISQELKLSFVSLAEVTIKKKSYNILLSKFVTFLKLFKNIDIQKIEESSSLGALSCKEFQEFFRKSTQATFMTQEEILSLVDGIILFINTTKQTELRDKSEFQKFVTHNTLKTKISRSNIDHMLKAIYRRGYKKDFLEEKTVSRGWGEKEKEISCNKALKKIIRANDPFFFTSLAKLEKALYTIAYNNLEISKLALPIVLHELLRKVSNIWLLKKIIHSNTRAHVASSFLRELAFNDICHYGKKCNIIYHPDAEFQIENFTPALDYVFPLEGSFSLSGTMTMKSPPGSGKTKFLESLYSQYLLIEATGTSSDIEKIIMAPNTDYQFIILKNTGEIEASSKEYTDSFAPEEKITLSGYQSNYLKIVSIISYMQRISQAMKGTSEKSERQKKIIILCDEIFSGANPTVAQETILKVITPHLSKNNGNRNHASIEGLLAVEHNPTTCKAISNKQIVIGIQLRSTNNRVNIEDETLSSFILSINPNEKEAFKEAINELKEATVTISSLATTKFYLQINKKDKTFDVIDEEKYKKLYARNNSNPEIQIFEFSNNINDTGTADSAIARYNEEENTLSVTPIIFSSMVDGQQAYALIPITATFEEGKICFSISSELFSEAKKKISIPYEFAHNLKMSYCQTCEVDLNDEGSYNQHVLLNRDPQVQSIIEMKSFEKNLQQVQKAQDQMTILLGEEIYKLTEGT
jgi:hypothetical protein